MDSSKGRKDVRDSILDIGVEKALAQSGFDFKAFQRRGGYYEWNKTKVMKK